MSKINEEDLIGFKVTLVPPERPDEANWSLSELMKLKTFENVLPVPRCVALEKVGNLAKTPTN
jgi:hypothetical protein